MDEKAMFTLRPFTELQRCNCNGFIMGSMCELTQVQSGSLELHPHLAVLEWLRYTDNFFSDTHCLKVVISPRYVCIVLQGGVSQSDTSAQQGAHYAPIHMYRLQLSCCVSAE